MLFSCEKTKGSDSASEETLMTEYSENLSIVMSQNGRRSYHFVTPLVEGYSLAREPYREFRKGVKITTYQDDSLSTVDAVLTANYAIYYEKRDLWEARGDVVVVKSDGKTLYTQQLFWNAKTKKIYSNVDSKIVQTGGRDVFIGEGFESDEEFKDWRFRRMKGRMEVEVTPTDQTDSTAADSPRDRSTASSRERSGSSSVPSDTPAAADARPVPPPRPARPAARPDWSATQTARPAQTLRVQPDRPDRPIALPASESARLKTVEAPSQADARSAVSEPQAASASLQPGSPQAAASDARTAASGPQAVLSDTTRTSR